MDTKLVRLRVEGGAAGAERVRKDCVEITNQAFLFPLWRIEMCCSLCISLLLNLQVS